MTLRRSRVAVDRASDGEWGGHWGIVLHGRLITTAGQGVLLPEQSAEITFTAYVDNDIAGKLNRQPNDLGGTLILHTLLGKDHFISISAEYGEFISRSSGVSTILNISTRIYVLWKCAILFDPVAWAYPDGQGVYGPVGRAPSEECAH